MSILEEIVENTRQELLVFKKEKPISEIQAEALALSKNLVLPPKSKKLKLIAEIKPKSPSVGTLRENFDPQEIAINLERKGAFALSVLTDNRYFGGSFELLHKIRQVVQIPILRKDFIIDIYQIWQTKAMGADLTLFIVKILSKDELLDFVQLALQINLLPLIEINNLAELDTALQVIHQLNCADRVMIGVNNRNLQTFQVDIQNSIQIIEYIPQEISRFSLSGIRTVENLENLQKAGFDGVLVAEGLVKNPSLLDWFA